MMKYIKNRWLMLLLSLLVLGGLSGCGDKGHEEHHDDSHGHQH